MNENEVEELLGAYALDALHADEMAAVRAHLLTCDAHAAKARELRAVADLIAETADPLDAPAPLRTRVLDAIVAEPRNSVRTPASIDSRRDASAAPSARVMWQPSNVLLFRARTWASIAAVLVVAVGGLLAWNLVLLNRGGSDANTFATHITSTGVLRSSQDAGMGTVLYLGDEHKAIVLGENVPKLDASRAYQMWSVGAGKPKSLGLMHVDDSGRTISVVAFDTSQAGTFAVTVEPAGGSEQPTSDPVFTATVEFRGRV